MMAESRMSRRVRIARRHSTGITLLEAIILIVLVALITAFLVAIFRAGVGRVVQVSIDRLVKAECAQVTRPVGNGSFDLTVGQIAEFGITDLAGPEFTVTKTKVKWRKRDDDCFYTLTIEGTKDGVTAEVESEESEVPC